MSSLKDFKQSQAELKIFSHPDGEILLQYTRAPNLKLTGFLTIKIPNELGKTTQVHSLNWSSRFSQESVVNSLINFQLQMFGDDPQSTAGHRSLIDTYRKLYNKGKNLKRILYDAQRKLTEEVLAPFERYKEVQRVKGNYTVSLYEREVIDLDDPSDYSKESEYIRLVFVKNKLGFGLAVDYRLLKFSDNGTFAGRVELTTSPPETIAGLYGAVQRGLFKMEKVKHLHPKKTEVINPVITQLFIDREVAITELLVRHHTFHI